MTKSDAARGIKADDSIEQVRGDEIEISDNNVDTIFEPLDKNELKVRMTNSFPSVYLTMVSIIQGVALGIFTQNTFGKATSLDSLIGIAPFAFASFLLIALTFFEYVWFVGIYRWSIKISDTFAPLLLGVTEIGALYHLDNPPLWWIINGALALAGTFAFSNTYRHCEPDMFAVGVSGKIGEVFDFTKRGIRYSMAITSIASIASFVAGLSLLDCQINILSDFYCAATHYFYVAIYIIFIALIFCLFAKDRYFIKRIHRSYGIRY